MAAAHTEEEACHTRLTAIQAQLVEHHRQRAVLEHELELFKQMEQQASQVAPDAVALAAESPGRASRPPWRAAVALGGNSPG